MQYTQLGRTGLEVSVAGLGCGGFSRLGLARGASPREAAALVGRALDAGVNFIDTAASYGTEQVVGEAIRGRDRDSLVISTKAAIARDGRCLPPADVVASLDASLRAMRVGHVDVFHLHGVAPAQLAHAREVIVPALERQKDAGKLRVIGITETPPRDAGHDMLDAALADDRFGVIMAAYHMLHQSAEELLFPRTRNRGVGVLGMFAVRVIFSQPDRLEHAFESLVASGELTASDASLSFLLHERGSGSIIDAAYRFCRHEPGVDVVLFGTGVPAHLDLAIASILGPPLPAPDVARLKRCFAHLRSVGLDAPGRIA